ncbi:5-deoxy-glucuronate isomerase [Geobacter pelophilus]|uniref:5-deoxy-glucuronate isomerase n=1 Tax=Geoanaerobacter pelophilus TaxID=60036 RepID=A0AAW4L7Y5_9BACT|nr:5-deoxy-glucuronate isomerase [Geoanaerobacter pelophilus]MBT0663922.1 5-deoxy-glucuronate isomerase [Geoanaerobacter pelophilus]
MFYQWSNANRLQTLQVSGGNNQLLFASEQEKAEVYLEGGTISRVVCHSKSGTTEILAKDAYHIVVGESNWQRDVYHFLKPGGPAPTLRLGITVHAGAGTWSSLPHPFELNLEPDFEEVFFHLLEGGSQSAVQLGRGVWADNTAVDEAWLVKDRTFSTIPMGYHPVVGEPHVKVAYVWAYLAKKPSWEKV